MHSGRLLGVLATLLLAGSVTLPAAGRTAAVGCPAAPSGWTAAPQNPDVQGPAQSPGTDNESVTCVYVNGKGLTISVRASFALPIDANPFSDFNYGCGSPSIAWNDSTREYLLTSTNRWSYVVFQDPSSVLGSGDVNTFESLSKKLLQSTDGAAHTCSVQKPNSAVANNWGFAFRLGLARKGFSASALVGSPTRTQTQAPVDAGSFQTKNTGKTPQVLAVKSPLVRVAVIDGGKHYTVTLRLAQGVTFHYNAAAVKGGNADAKAQLQVKVRVVHSNEPACPARSAGTLTLSTLPSSASLDLCGSLFGTGKHHDTVDISQA
jgi:hypothetical protein